uniref:Uncharacterized protein n=1 Tax=Vitis vinifera TaxID=29760 RepID=F6GXN2_VITVI
MEAMSLSWQSKEDM